MNSTINSLRSCGVLVIYLFLLIPFHSIAQTTDLQLRTELGIAAKLSKNTAIGIAVQQRFNKYIATKDALLFEGSLKYKFNKKIQSSIYYRFTNKQNKEYKLASSQRLNVNLRYKNKIGSLGYKISSGLQYGFSKLSVFDEYYSQKFYNKSSIELDYTIINCRLTPFVNADIFYRINNRAMGALNKHRMGAGVNIYINKSSEVDLYYFFENEYKQYQPKDAHIIGVKYNYSF